jgi:hypothetical protein
MSSFRWTIALLLGVFSLCASAQVSLSAKPDLTLTGTATRADFMHYLEVPFTVPEHVTRVSVELNYTEKDKRTTLDLGVYDSERFRGWSGGNKNFFSIGVSDATPSYLSGLIPAGQWHVILGVPSIHEGVTSHYEIKVWFGHGDDKTAVSTFSREPLRAGPAWFRGDLHMHDGHSDGSCNSQSGKRVPCPLYRTVESAAKRGLDFISITDHNTTAHYDAMRELQPAFDQLLLIPGREITTFYGHANVWGTAEQIDFRLGSSSVPDFATIQNRVQQLGAILSLNHPASPSGEACMGCGWTAKTDWSRITAIEAVNGGTTSGPRSGIPYWEARLNEGYRIAGIGGSDNHNGPAPLQFPSSIGWPTTVVYAANLSEHAILDGIRAGHVYVVTQGTKSTMEWTADAGGQHGMMGDILHAETGTKVQFALALSGVENGTPEIIEDGNIVAKAAETSSFSLTSDGKRHWVRVNVRDANGELLIMGNPIYLNF